MGKYNLEQLRGAWAAGKNQSSKDSDPLIGKWFHGIEEKNDIINTQGQILKKVNDETYLGQFYSWITGYATNQFLVTLDQMNHWDFYDSDKDMRIMYQIRKK